MITSALIRPSFVADTLRHTVIEITTARPIPHKVVRLVPSPAFEHGRHGAAIISPALRPYTHTVATAQGLLAAVLPYLNPMPLKYPSTSADVSR